MTISTVSYARYERQRKARLEAEKLLEDKSRELYESRQSLFNLSVELEKRVEERTRELENQTRELTLASTARENFLANITHELRTPLQGILGFAKLGSRRAETSTSEKIGIYFDTIEKSGNTLLTLVNNLLDISKFDAGMTKLDCSNFDITELIHEIEQEFLLRCEEKNVEIHIAEYEEYLVIADRFRLLQVLRNLISNAIKFCHSNSTITISLECRDALTHVSVSNEGPNIPPDELKIIFDPFVEASNTRNKSGGTGLGLAICKQIVCAHGGSINVMSSDELTCFFFSFPDNLNEGVIECEAA